MPVVIDDVRKLATVETISAVVPIEGADAIEQVQVRGWMVVVKKIENYRVGDRVVYFEVDTAIPVSDPRFAELAGRDTKSDPFFGDVHVLKTIRLRGVYSQGFVLPLDRFADVVDISNIEDGADLTQILKMGKWEIPVPGDGGKQKGNFLTQYARKTDSERAQNLGKVWDRVVQHKWEASEKIDGTSCTVVRDENGDLRVMSRNWEMTEGDNVYWNVVKHYHEMFDLLQPREGLQFEIAGPGVLPGKNPLDLKEVRPFVFDMVRNGEMVPRSEWPSEVLKWAAPLRPDVTVEGSATDMVAKVDGLKSVVTPSRLAEGVVFHSVDGGIFPEVGNRNTFKIVSSKYLSKEK